ncbi:Lrp/AsnC family transcriptional regulator [Phreatobacter sp. AB_2022a]|uniref:Lrp/AsnC family transcriptional regulator n=1 Tax=Phreatobacter sp. AB_2022a TaxID=3003134 RepID=UPI00056EAA3E|nr:Lrp/AsnC family transcriptional regulator [Phreatobacter sp. AB_2022a]MCZ0733724.1 Lrp/AsnC family transcriptional regulator [Phreatobacter sp. AB_2022a]
MPSQSPALDAYDKSIMREIQRDSSLSIEALAERVHLSRNACWRRLKRLEEEGFIAARVALADPVKLNLELTVFIAVRTARHDAAWAERFHTVVRDIPELIGAYRTAGEIDYILHARVPDVAAYDRLYKKLTSRIDMQDVSASFVMEEIKEVTALPLDFV